MVGLARSWIVVGSGGFFGEVFIDQIDFASDDGFDAFAFGGFLEVDRAVHRAVVRHGDCRHIHFGDAAHEVFDADGTVEHAVGGVHVQVHKLFLGHEQTPGYKTEHPPSRWILFSITDACFVSSVLSKNKETRVSLRKTRGSRSSCLPPRLEKEAMMAVRLMPLPQL